VYFVGVDGCKGQCWLAVIFGAEGRAEARVFSDIFALWRECKAASLILIDIPIGLRDGGALERRCDKEARKRLGPKRGASVFPVPCRAARKADGYEEASEMEWEVLRRTRNASAGKGKSSRFGGRGRGFWRESGMRRQSSLDLYTLYRVECKARRKIRSD
jgi:predicted RNase H-like nuclease